MYKTNDEGQYRYEYVNKNFLYFLVFTPISNSFIIWIMYLSTVEISISLFYAMLAFILVYLAFDIYSALRKLKRQNRTISEVTFSNEDIIIKTDKILWLKAKEYKINKSVIHLKNRKFKWYGKNIKKDGATIFINDLELYLVKDYFDDYDIIIKLFA